MITGRELALDLRVTSPFAAELCMRLVEPKPTKDTGQISYPPFGQVHAFVRNLRPAFKGERRHRLTFILVDECPLLRLFPNHIDVPVRNGGP